MGRGKRIIRWLKKRLFGKKANNTSKKDNNKKKGEKYLSEQPSPTPDLIPDQSEIAGLKEPRVEKAKVTAHSTPDSLNVELGDCETSLLNRERELEHELDTLAPQDHQEGQQQQQQQQTGDQQQPQGGDNTSTTSPPRPIDSILEEFGNVGRERRPPLLSPIENAYQSANIKPGTLPKLDITTSRQGNMAFELHTLRPKTPKPVLFSDRSSPKEKKKKKRKRSTRVRDALLRTNRSKRRREKLAKLRAAGNEATIIQVKPFSGDSSKLSDLQDVNAVPSSFTRGAAFQVAGTQPVRASSKLEKKRCEFYDDDDDDDEVSIIKL